MIDQAEFVQRCVAAANDLALLYAGESSEEKMLAALLHQTRANLEAKLAEPFGPDVAAQMAEASSRLSSVASARSMRPARCRPSSN